MSQSRSKSSEKTLSLDVASTHWTISACFVPKVLLSDSKNSWEIHILFQRSVPYIKELIVVSKFMQNMKVTYSHLYYFTLEKQKNNKALIISTGQYF